MGALLKIYTCIFVQFLSNFSCGKTVWMRLKASPALKGLRADSGFSAMFLVLVVPSFLGRDVSSCSYTAWQESTCMFVCMFLVLVVPSFLGRDVSSCSYTAWQESTCMFVCMFLVLVVPSFLGRDVSSCSYTAWQESTCISCYNVHHFTSPTNGPGNALWCNDDAR